MADSLAAMRLQDERVATIGHRLAISNPRLLRGRSWLPGFRSRAFPIWRRLRDAAIRAFGVGMEPSVLAVAAGGPAERAGLRRTMSCCGWTGSTARRARPRGPREMMETLLAAIERAFADGSANVD
jgi:hypothetical protein